MFVLFKLAFLKTVVTSFLLVLLTVVANAKNEFILLDFGSSQFAINKSDILSKKIPIVFAGNEAHLTLCLKQDVLMKFQHITKEHSGLPVRVHIGQKEFPIIKISDFKSNCGVLGPLPRYVAEKIDAYFWADNAELDLRLNTVSGEFCPERHFVQICLEQEDPFSYLSKKGKTDGFNILEAKMTPLTEKLHVAIKTGGNFYLYKHKFEGAEVLSCQVTDSVFELNEEQQRLCSIEMPLIKKSLQYKNDVRFDSYKVSNPRFGDDYVSEWLYETEEQKIEAKSHVRADGSFSNYSVTKITP